MTTRLLAAAAAVALLATLIINGPFGIDEGTYREIYSALAPKTAPVRDAQQQSENKLPNPEDQIACLIGQAAVSIHGQFGSGHDTEKAAEIAITQAMRVSDIFLSEGRLWVGKLWPDKLGDQRGNGPEDRPRS